MTSSGVKASVSICLCALVLALLSGGCITVYQPMTSLQKPAAIRYTENNFKDVRMLIRCFPGEYLKPADAQRVCSKVSSLFANQGAQVDIDIPFAGGGGIVNEIAGKKPDMVVELRSRLQHTENPGWMWVACVATCSLIPAYTEFSFAQDISIRDSEGFELASDTLQARFVTYTGAGVWTVNWVLDLLVREEAEEMTGGAAERDFSKDFYRQLNQLAWNAHVRSAVLRSFGEGGS